MKKSIVVEIKDEKVEINFPNNGDIVSIDNLRSELSFGTYSNDREDDGNQILGCFTFLYTMVPEFMEKHGMAKFSWGDKSPHETFEYLYVYRTQILPWLNDTYKELDELKAKLDEKLEKVNAAREKAKK